MKSSNTLIIAGVLLVVGLVNAWVLKNGIADFNQSFRFKDFTSDSSQPSPTVAVLPNNVVVVTNTNEVNSYRVDDKGNLIWQSRTWPNNAKVYTRETLPQQ